MTPDERKESAIAEFLEGLTKLTRETGVEVCSYDRCECPWLFFNPGNIGAMLSYETGDHANNPCWGFGNAPR